MVILHVFLEPGYKVQSGLVEPSFGIFTDNQTAEGWLPRAWLGVNHPTKQAPSDVIGAQELAMWHSSYDLVRILQPTDVPTRGITTQI